MFIKPIGMSATLIWYLFTESVSRFRQCCSSVVNALPGPGLDLQCPGTQCTMVAGTRLNRISLHIAAASSLIAGVLALLVLSLCDCTVASVDLLRMSFDHFCCVKKRLLQWCVAPMQDDATKCGPSRCPCILLHL